MGTWQRRFHITLTIGGGFTALSATLGLLLGSWNQLNGGSVAIIFAFAVLYAWFVLIGLRFIEGREVTRELGAFYVLQVPYFAAPGISYHMGIGLSLFLGKLTTGQNIRYQLGADWQLLLLQGNEWGFAINLLPLVMLFLLWRADQRKRAEDARPPEAANDEQLPIQTTEPAP